VNESTLIFVGDGIVINCGGFADVMREDAR
jgi:hypothetical protein